MGHRASNPKTNTVENGELLNVQVQRGSLSLKVGDDQFHGSRSALMVGGDVFVDGEGVATGIGPQTIVHVTVTGDARHVSTTSGDIVVHQNAGTISTVSGAVQVGGHVNTGVSTVSGAINASHIIGHVSSTSGNVQARF